MTDQLALPFVSIVGASSSAPPEASPDVRKPRRRASARPPRLPLSPAAPAPARQEEGLDIADYLVRNPSSTFLFQMRDDSMQGAGIFSGDYLVLDKSIHPRHGHLVLALVNGERLVKRLYHHGKKTALQAEHPDYPDLVPEDGSELTIWGVVVGQFRRMTP